MSFVLGQVVDFSKLSHELRAALLGKLIADAMEVETHEATGTYLVVSVDCANGTVTIKSDP